MELKLAGLLLLFAALKFLVISVIKSNPTKANHKSGITGVTSTPEPAAGLPKGGPRRPGKAPEPEQSIMNLSSLFKSNTPPAFVPDPTPAQLAAWAQQYGSVVHQPLTLNGMTLYMRAPTDREAAQIIRRLTAGSRRLKAGAYVKEILQLCALGGDEQLKTDPELIKLLKHAWETL